MRWPLFAAGARKLMQLIIGRYGCVATCCSGQKSQRLAANRLVLRQPKLTGFALPWVRWRPAGILKHWAEGPAFGRGRQRKAGVPPIPPDKPAGTPAHPGKAPLG